MMTFSTAVQSPQQGYYSPQSKYLFQTKATPVSLAAKPPLHKDLSSPGDVSVFQPKPESFLCDNSNTTALPATFVILFSCPGPGSKDSNVTLASPSMGGSPDHLAQTPHKSNFTAPFNHSQPSYATQ